MGVPSFHIKYLKDNYDKCSEEIQKQLIGGPRIEKTTLSSTDGNIITTHRPEEDWSVYLRSHKYVYSLGFKIFSFENLSL